MSMFYSDQPSIRSHQLRQNQRQPIIRAIRNPRRDTNDHIFYGPQMDENKTKQQDGLVARSQTVGNIGKT